MSDSEYGINNESCGGDSGADGTPVNQNPGVCGKKFGRNRRKRDLCPGGKKRGRNRRKRNLCIRWEETRGAARILLFVLISLIIGLSVYRWNAERLAGNAMPMPVWLRYEPLCFRAVWSPSCL